MDKEVKINYYNTVVFSIDNANATISQSGLTATNTNLKDWEIAGA